MKEYNTNISIRLPISLLMKIDDEVERTETNRIRVIINILNEYFKEGK